MEARPRLGQREVAHGGARLAFRPASGADRPFVRSLTGTAFAAYGDYDAIMDGWLSDPRTRTVIVEIDGNLVGFAMWAAPSERSGEVVLVSLALIPEQRGRGLGHRLLDAVHHAIAAEVLGISRSVALDVAEDNAAARALFRKAGYREVPEFSERYPAGHRALRMMRWLPAVASRD